MKALRCPSCGRNMWSATYYRGGAYRCPQCGVQLEDAPDEREERPPESTGPSPDDE